MEWDWGPPPPPHPSPQPGVARLSSDRAQPWVGCFKPPAPFRPPHPQLGSALGLMTAWGQVLDTCCLSLLYSPEPSVKLSCVHPSISARHRLDTAQLPNRHCEEGPVAF